MRQPLPRFDLIQLDGVSLAPLLALDPKAILSYGSASTALRHFFLEVSEEAILAAIRTDDAALRAVSETHGIDTLGVWCRKQPAEATAAIRLRDFCHGVGDPEEAASGTTNGALACLLWRAGAIKANSEGRLEIDAEQGYEMGRPSRISTRLTVRDGVISEVAVGGSASRRLHGQLEV
jgi:predicted PhzF superfamily epimerase YddE/YHI9